MKGRGACLVSGRLIGDLLWWRVCRGGRSQGGDCGGGGWGGAIDVDHGRDECASLKWPRLELLCWSDLAPPSTI